MSLAQHEDTLIHRVELLHSPQHIRLAERVKEDIASVSPDTDVRLIEMALADPWDFGEVYAALYDWVKAYSFREQEREEYWRTSRPEPMSAQLLHVLVGGGRVHTWRAVADVTPAKADA